MVFSTVALYSRCSAVFAAAPRSRYMSSMTRLALVGAPGAGKGSFARPIGLHLDIPFISTGDLIRDQIKQKTEIGLQIKGLAAQGKLVDDATVLDILKQRLAMPDAEKGFLLDGFPRRQSQAKLLEEITSLDMVINIDLLEDVLVLKAISRRVCEDCGRGYNIADINQGDIQMSPLLPEKENTCDSCQGALVQREDDTEEVVRDRLQTYKDETMPLIKHYTDAGTLRTFEVKKGMKDVPRMLEMLDRELSKE